MIGTYRKGRYHSFRRSQSAVKHISQVIDRDITAARSQREDQIATWVVQTQFNYDETAANQLVELKVQRYDAASDKP